MLKAPMKTRLILTFWVGIIRHFSPVSHLPDSYFLNSSERVRPVLSGVWDIPAQR